MKAWKWPWRRAHEPYDVLAEASEVAAGHDWCFLEKVDGELVKTARQHRERLLSLRYPDGAPVYRARD